MAELCRRSGVPVATIKFYIRLGLLPAGRLTSPTRASYDGAHEHRLRLIRALLDAGGLSLAAIGDVLRAVDDPDRPPADVLRTATDHLTPPRETAPGPELDEARAEVARLVRRLGWRADADGPAGEALAGVLVALRAAGHGDFAVLLDDYAAAAERVARAELGHLGRPAARAEQAERVVVGTVLGEAMFSALRGLAHADAWWCRLHPDSGARCTDADHTAAAAWRRRHGPP
ncbi:MerR family transcriptional regulator [Streptomyces sp. SID2563]|uniref:MerR family transcriptional regulator n=1 Tax=Streptomyces sp. SID2563 TaxID=2690255 RepID=UPI001370491E|nr:MerR family transcriptional regulator [Streptomyces sp. SID2563]MYW11386.1 MerR family transcriptional regulator [Streptomyces sp. SID2563]